VILLLETVVSVEWHRHQIQLQYEKVECET